MKRFASLMMLLCLSSFVLVGCGDGKSTEPGPDLEVETNLDADMAEQAKMSEEGGGAEVDPDNPAAP